MKADGLYLIVNIERIGDCAGLGVHFQAAIDFIRRGRLAELPTGRHEIDGDDVYVNVADVELAMPLDRRGELHKAYFDIHVPIGGDEVIGFAKRDPKAEMKFDEARDIGFCDQRLEWHTVRRGEFAVVWPVSCVHAPACTDGAPHTIRKLVFKVRA